MWWEVVSDDKDNIRREAVPLWYPLLSPPFLRDLTQMMVLIDLNGSVNKICEQLHAFLRLFDGAENGIGN
jgi:hypothetical protein